MQIKKLIVATILDITGLMLFLFSRWKLVTLLALAPSLPTWWLLIIGLFAISSIGIGISPSVNFWGLVAFFGLSIWQLSSLMLNGFVEWTPIAVAATIIFYDTGNWLRHLFLKTKPNYFLLQ
ncbi:MAG: hypothetical protein M0Z41_01600 [Peptococcaceae bacterium]|nr:hypothetical protein [Peptococcaceae bacterium]